MRKGPSPESTQCWVQAHRPRPGIKRHGAPTWPRWRLSIHSGNEIRSPIPHHPLDPRSASPAGPFHSRVSMSSGGATATRRRHPFPPTGAAERKGWSWPRLPHAVGTSPAKATAARTS